MLPAYVKHSAFRSVLLRQLGGGWSIFHDFQDRPLSAGLYSYGGVRDKRVACHRSDQQLLHPHWLPLVPFGRQCRHTIIAESVGQQANHRIYYLLIATDVLQVLLMTAKYLVEWITSDRPDYLDESYSQIVFTTLAVAVLLYQTYQFIKHLKFMQLIYSRTKLLKKVGLMAVGAFARIAYNIYYILAITLNEADDKGDWMIDLDEKCQRKNHYYGLFLCCIAILLFVCPILGAHSLFNSPLSSTSQVDQLAKRQSSRSVLSRGSVEGSLLE